MRNKIARCEKCGKETKELFEEPINSQNLNVGKLFCNDCKNARYSSIGKGRIIDEVARRETTKLRFGDVDEVATPSGI